MASRHGGKSTRTRPAGQDAASVLLDGLRGGTVRCRIAAMEPTPRTDWLRLLRAAGAVALFGAFVAAAACAVMFETARAGNVTENGPVEFAQLAVLVAASLVFGLRARAAARTGNGPSLAFALCGLALLALAVRELDGFFDNLLFHGAWALVDAVVLAAFLAVALRRPSRMARDLADFAAGPECPLFAAGIVLAVLFAQGIGSKHVWRHVFDVPFWTDAVAPLRTPEGELPGEIDVLRHVKNTVEESFELASYLLLLASAALPPLLSPRRRAGPRDRQTV